MKEINECNVFLICLCISILIFLCSCAYKIHMYTWTLIHVWHIYLEKIIILRIHAWWCEMGKTWTFRSRSLVVVAVRLEIAQGGCWAIKACVGRHGQRTEHCPTASSLASSQAQTFLSRPLPGADMFLFCPIVTASTGGWCTRMCLSRLGDCNLRTLCPCLLWAPTTWPGIQLDPSMCATLEASEHRVTKGDISESFSWPQTMAVTTSFLSPHL